MQPQTSIDQVLEHTSTSDLLVAVEARMIACTSSCTALPTRVPEKSTSAFAAAAYHLGVGGHRVRAKLALEAARVLGLSTADAVTIASAVELLHNASLVHDDIQDRDNTRRGQKTVWVEFGVNTAICTGDLLLSAAYAALCKIEKSQALPAMILLVHERTAIAIDGQCADLKASPHAANDTASAIANYQQIAVAKSGALLCLPIELALLACGQDRYLPDARHAAEAFSIGYQIVDDLNDVQNDTGADAASGAINIIAIYKAWGCADESIKKAKQIGRYQLDVAAEFAARLPCGAGALMVDYASQLRQLLSEQN